MHPSVRLSPDIEFVHCSRDRWYSLESQVWYVPHCAPCQLMHKIESQEMWTV